MVRKTTINIGELPNQQLAAIAFWRRHKKNPKPFYEKENKRVMVMERDRPVTRDELRFAQARRLPTYEVKSSDTLIDITRHQGRAMELLGRTKGQGRIFLCWPTGKKLFAYKYKGEIKHA